MKIIVTGGHGFIGSALIRFLHQNTSHKIVNIDKLTYASNKQSLKDLDSSERYKFFKVDICDKHSLKDIFENERPNILFNLAAETHVDRSIDGPYDFVATNILGTFTLLEVTRDFLTNIKTSINHPFLFQHISTDEVFGSLGKDGFFNEMSKYDPSSPYSASKASSDHLVRAWGKTYNIPFIITNCSNNYGPFQSTDKLIPLVIKNAISGKNIPIYGDGSQVRDWLYVNDHVSALWLIANKGCKGESYNIGGNNEKTNLEVVNKICLILDRLVPISSKKSYKEQIMFVEDRPAHDFRYAIDSTKLKDQINWSPIETFSSGLLKTIEWYLSEGLDK